MSAPDQAVAARPEIHAILPAMMKEAFRTGHEGPAWELTRIVARPWGFDVRDVTLPVILWQGEEDKNVPVAWGRWFARTLPQCTAHFIPGGGHLLIFDHWDEILAAALD